MFTPHQNPLATFETNTTHYEQYSLTRAYNGETFYWAPMPQPGEFILIRFQNPTQLSGFKFVSGNAEHPSDLFEKATIQVLPNDPYADLSSLTLQKSSGGFFVVGVFDKNGVAEGDINYNVMGKVKELRILVGKNHENSIILSEIHLKTAE